MSDTDWQRIWDLFFGALELDAPQRSSWLDAECVDPRLRAEVRALLAAHDDAPSLLDEPLHLPDDSRPAEADEMIGSTIDRYHVLREIGSGGMGTVYEAEQVAPVRRRVALKLVKLGMDTREIVARFEQERQALAIMSHANIARVFDGGALDNGRPYFVMELVDGVPITEYCDGERLPLAARLALFMAVCDGVQHAHQRGIIHRDLKPSNVLVTLADGAPVPKIIDFGVAKAIHAAADLPALQTRLGLALGTPAYMSPEQWRSGGGEVDTRTDVYALSVLLYELAVGDVPFDRNAGAARAVDPPPPSQKLAKMGAPAAAAAAAARATGPRELLRALQGELDWIALKGLSNERSERYGSPGELAADLRRYLAQQPVEAHPPSTAYRVRKFVRRHRLGVAAAAVVTLATVFIAVAMSVQAVRLQRALARAEREQARAEQVSAFLVGLFRGANPAEASRADMTARQMLDSGARRLDGELAAQPEVRARVRQTIGTAYREIGAYEQAGELLRKALAELPQPSDPLLAGQLLNALGEVNHDAGELDAADSSYREALALRRSGGAGDGPVADTMYNQATLALDRGDTRQGLALATEALALHERAYGRASEQAASDLMTIGRAHYLLGDYAAAEAMMREGVAAVRALPDRQHQLAFALNSYAAVHQAIGRHGEAVAMLAEALAIYRRVLGADHAYVAATLINLAQAQIAAGDYARAESAAAEAATSLLGQVGDAHRNYASARLQRAIALYRLGRYDDAAEHAGQVLSLDRRIRPGSLDVADSAFWAGTIARARGRLDEALRLLEESLALRVAALGETHAAAAVRMQLGLVKLARNDVAAARAEVLAALSVNEQRFGHESTRVAANLVALATVHSAEGDVERARQVLRDALATQRRLLPPQHPETAATLHALGAAELRGGEPATAESLLREALAVRADRLPATHTDLAETRALLAGLLCADGRATEGRMLLAAGRRADLMPVPASVAASLREADARCR